MKTMLAGLLFLPFVLNGGGAAALGIPAGSGVGGQGSGQETQNEPAYFRNGTLDFEARIWAQEQIERIFYEHRIWPKENPGPKPAFETMVPRSLIEERAKEALLKSAAMEKYWQRVITPEMLQAEVERMAKGTQDAATLRELFAALHDDPRLIAETLGRQTLADRLLRSNYAWDLRLHEQARARANGIAAKIASVGATGRSPVFDWKSLGGEYHRHTFVLDEKGEQSPMMPGMEPDTTRMKAEEFSAMKKKYSQSAVGATGRSPVPGLREYFHSGDLPVAPATGPHPTETADGFVLQRAASITDTRIEIESIVIQKVSFDEWWSGVIQAGLKVAAANPNPQPPTPGFVFRLPEITAVAGCDQWTSPAGLNNILPAGRSDHTAVWTGSEMIIWGGNDGTNDLNTGGRYNPATDTWAPTSLGTNLPTPHRFHTAVWTGTEMIIWGGDLDFQWLNTGGRYNPLTNKWTPTSTGVNVPTARDGQAAVWTGSEMIIWGGRYNTGGRYNPQTDSWLLTSTGANVPSQRGAVAVWTGTEMIVWGGFNFSAGYLNTGGRYNPVSDSWLPTSTGANLPQARAGNSAVWTGTEMIIWGGNTTGSIQLNTGGRYNPASDSWQPTSTGTNVPAARRDHAAVWTGSRMIIWGGDQCSGSPCGGVPINYNDGGRYDPVTDTWMPTSLGANVPAVRIGPAAVWTGSEMIVWGGWQCTSNPCPEVYLNNGGRYNPVSDTWIPTSLGGNVPEGRRHHSAIWTGSDMVIWGGDTFGGLILNTGGRYNLSTDNWMPTSTVNAPSARDYHVSVWTGNDIIIWGGGIYSCSPSCAYVFYNTGGKYNPTSGNWTPTSTGVNVPSPRAPGPAVWSGSEMIVWGGQDSSMALLNTGGRYNPAGDSWIPTSTGVNTPSARGGHSDTWIGDEMIIWGGIDTGGYVNNGGRYRPLTDTWMPTTIDNNTPQARISHSAIWSGDEMVVWGGSAGGSYLNTGGRFNPKLNSWVTTSTAANVPAPRSASTTVWSGTEMIVWGGIIGPLTGSDSGSRYNSSADAWLSTSVGANSPDHRYLHTAIWTGSSMIVWGGQTMTTNTGTNIYDFLNTGGVYTSGSVGSPGNSLRVSRDGGYAGLIRLSWAPIYGANYYNIKRCNLGATACIPDTITDTPHNWYYERNDSLSHFYAVEAVNQCGATP